MSKTLNEVYSSLSMKRRYEVWFLRLGLADGSGAWWFRYLLMNPYRSAGDAGATVGNLVSARCESTALDSRFFPKRS
jgi:hypothetical protein